MVTDWFKHCCQSSDSLYRSLFGHKSIVVSQVTVYTDHYSDIKFHNETPSQFTNKIFDQIKTKVVKSLLIQNVKK